MNPFILAALASQRRRTLDEEFARGDVLGDRLRVLTGRALRSVGEGLFRLGVSLDERGPATPVAELQRQ